MSNTQLNTAVGPGILSRNSTQRRWRSAGYLARAKRQPMQGGYALTRRDSRFAAA